MKIAGLQKLSLLDFPDKMACTVFTLGCNFRCPFCHNASLVTKVSEAQIIGTDELISFLSSRKGILDGVCITGGEPTLQSGLEDLIIKIKKMGFAVKLDTNGYAPDILKALVQSSLVDYVAMDIKNSRKRYAETAGLPSLDITKIEESVSLLIGGSVDFEFRTTVVKEYHTEEDIADIAEWIGQRENIKYYLQSFKDSGDIIKDSLNSCSDEELKKMLEIARKRLPCASLRGI